jgi:transcription-repair coupling factor
MLAAYLHAKLNKTVFLVCSDLQQAEAARDDLEFFLGPEPVLFFPEEDHSLTVHSWPPTVRNWRLTCLAKLAINREPHVVVASARALLRKVPLPEVLRVAVVSLKVGDESNPEELGERLGFLGYGRLPAVEGYGDWSRRGGIVDVFSFGRENPLRIEFGEERIESIREFDPTSQRSVESLEEAFVYPTHELVLDNTRIERAANALEARGDEPFSSLADTVRHNVYFEGVEWLAALYHRRLCSPVSYVPRDAVLVALDPTGLEAAMEERERELDRFLERGFEPPFTMPYDPGEIFLSSDEVIRAMTSFNRLDVLTLGFARATAGAAHLRQERPWEGARSPGVPGNGPPTELADKHDTPSQIRRATDEAAGSTESEKEGAQSTDGFRGESAEPGTIGETEPAESGDGIRQESPEPEIAGRRGAEVGGEHTRPKTAGAPSPDTPEPAALAPPSGPDPTAPKDQPPVFKLGGRSQEPVARRMDALRSYLLRLHEEDLTTYILCDNKGQRDRLEEILGDAPARLEIGVIGEGFSLPEAGLALLTDHQIFQRFRRRRRRRPTPGGIPIRHLMSLQQGNYVVHIDHGIGVYRGLRRIVVDGHETDCLYIDYAQGDRLFIPVDQLHLVQKYVAEEGRIPTLNRLGSAAWSRTKAKVKKAVKDMAEDLIKAYATRKARPGHAFSPDTTWQAELESSFMYEETPDQEKASLEIKGDMEDGRPMDRLVCGDVGYGKTELAVRAAFKSVMDHKQVCMLVPTTVLAEQHLTTFRERMERFPVRIEVLSRFKTRAEQRRTVEALDEGRVDIVIGTHRLLQKDIGFKDLGLVVIDEEQRFGVAHKERIRGVKALADVLTMTATPIPRTLHMSLMGARDMSVINTPPKGRYPIHTEIVDFNDEVIADAILREVDRGGQCFFIHNWVQSIDAMADFVVRLVPQVRVAVAHGQMAERRLEKVMLDFMDKKYDVLVSSMIVESGLDMPNVNTIIINRADRFGLAQLYQLRGRVGRSHVKAHAYLLVPPRRVLTEDAMKRLRVLEEFEDLGSGLKIALRDLEIRGAGNLLGPEQHGFLWSVGFDMYCRLLEEAVRELKGEEVERVTVPKMVTNLDAYLPDDYVPDGGEKVNIYKRLAEAFSLDEINSLREELVDRFGEPPEPARTLLDLRRARLLAGFAGMGHVSIKRGMIEAEGAGEFTKREVRRLLKKVSLPVELYGRQKLGIRLRTGEIDPLRPGLTLFTQMAEGLGKVK